MHLEVDEFAPLSGLQHYVFCHRQAALIHVEKVWQDNVLTVQGTILHERADLPGIVKSRQVQVVRALFLFSTRLQFRGRADIVEYHTSSSGEISPIPVEYKSGVTHHRLADQVQLCAQAYCLEELHQKSIPKGFLYYGKSHRRLEILFTPKLRQLTEESAKGFHQLLKTKMTPKAEPGLKCKNCSLLPSCLPELSQIRIHDYIQSLYQSASSGD